MGSFLSWGCSGEAVQFVYSPQGKEGMHPFVLQLLGLWAWGELSHFLKVTSSHVALKVLHSVPRAGQISQMPL